MNALKDLFASERGFLVLALIVGATVLAALGYMTIAQWMDYSQLMFGIYVGGKTISSLAVAIGNKPAASTPPAGSVTVSGTIESNS